MLMEFDLEDNIAEVRKSAKKAVDGHRHSFLHRYLEHSESQMMERERDKDIFKMPMQLRKHPTAIVGGEKKEETK
jgi:hypothetical protein